MTAPGTARRTGAGFGRLLVVAYGILAVAATARASVQLLRDWHEAPLAYGLSAVAAVVYVVATVALARGGPAARRVAWAAVTFELVGVLAVGTLSLVDPQAFPRATVWSGFGSGYGYVPLVLPFVGLWWLWRTRPVDGATAGARPAPSTHQTPEDLA
ncbi:hypothetical protein [Cellulosimicrobium cellulans]|uniref:hypothetical protein n=1 Tax=Cellulosimicrobium cellulans TaxID=1710 RepID=UPI0008496E48|nr:hypothetical protein [Cellulosimicrobium cellulans]